MVKDALALLLLLFSNDNPCSLIKELIHFCTINNFKEKDKFRCHLPGHVPFVQINSQANYSKEHSPLCKKDLYVTSLVLDILVNYELKCFDYPDCVSACKRTGFTAKLLLQKNSVCWSRGGLSWISFQASTNFSFRS